MALFDGLVGLEDSTHPTTSPQLKLWVESF